MKKRLALFSLAALAFALAAHAQMLPLPAETPGESATADNIAKLPAWDVVSVKEHKKDDNNMRWAVSSDGMQFTNFSVQMVLQQAYELFNSGEDRITGLPKWAKDAHFDIEAKVGAGDVATWKKLNAAQRAAMLRTLLADRFALQAHTITTDLPVYALVVAKSGPKLTPAKPEILNPEGKPIRGGTWSTSRGGIEVTDNTLAPLISMLTQSSGRTVEDRTGLTGKYDYKLNWTPDDVAGSNASDSGIAAAPPLFTALQEQLGLKLESARGPVQGLVIDKVEMPSAN